MLESYESAVGVEQALRMLAGPSLPPEDLAGVTRDTLGGAPEAKREWTERGMVADLEVAAGYLDVPTTVPAGSLDKVKTPERLRAIFEEPVPQVSFRELPGVGHLSPLEAPRQFADACDSMLETIAHGRKLSGT